jgi:hypothetical protein
VSVVKLNAPYLSDNALIWASKVISDRIGVQVKISNNDEFSLNLFFEKIDLTIIQDNLVNDFANPYASLNYATWDASTEGFIPILNMPIPLPGYSNPDLSLVEEFKDTIYLHVDLIGLIYWSLVRVEEYNNSNLDLHKRFDYKASHSKRFGYLNRPIVDEWIDILKQILKLKYPGLELRNDKYSIVLSHDVDRPYFYLYLSFLNLIKLIIADILKRLNFISAIKRIKYWFVIKKLKKLESDPYNTFDFIMQAAERRDVKCTFYFLTSNRNKNFDSDYTLEDECIIKLMKNIHNRNHIIGLHPSYETYLDSKLLNTEKSVLIESAKRNGIDIDFLESRMHYLRFDIKNTSQMLSDCGVKRDSSLNFSLESGFRCGTCFDYPMFDHYKQIELFLIQRPLLIMDNNFLPLDSSQLFLHKIQNVFKIKENCKAVGGNFTVLWHNSELYNLKLRELFLRVIS